MRVLLFSPVAGRDAPGGDITYTETLLQQPPPGVVYTTYAQALDQGLLTIRGRRPRGRPHLTDLGLLCLRGLDALPRGRLAYREAPWFVSFTGDDFDLVHQHLFGVVQVGPRRLPSVSSAGFPLAELYRNRERWGPRRVRFAEAYQSRSAKLVAAHSPGYYAPPTGIMTVYTEHYQQKLSRRLGVEVQVAGQGLPEVSSPSAPSSVPTIAFIGRDFARKGGPATVAAFRELQARGVAVRLVVITADAEAVTELRRDPAIEVHADLPRERVLTEILPTTDVLVLPTKADCGAPYTVIEALQGGAGLVVSRSPWLSERLTGPAVRQTADDPQSVADAIESLLAGPRDVRREAARELWQREFSMPQLHSQLVEAYQRALAGP